ncbi:MAG: hypothetical protein V1724_02005 [Chloroflexota bacterium]
MEEQNTPDVYCDGMQIQVSPFGIILQLTQIPPTPGTVPPKSVAYVRMSLEHAKVVAIVLRRVLKQHEDTQGGAIVLHPQLYQQLGISRQEDW